MEVKTDMNQFFMLTKVYVKRLQLVQERKKHKQSFIHNLFWWFKIDGEMNIQRIDTNLHISKKSYEFNSFSERQISNTLT